MTFRVLLAGDIAWSGLFEAAMPDMRVETRDRADPACLDEGFDLIAVTAAADAARLRAARADGPPWLLRLGGDDRAGADFHLMRMPGERLLANFLLDARRMIAAPAFLFERSAPCDS